eukprot:767971-Hanusia_phi.AAC.7
MTRTVSATTEEQKETAILTQWHNDPPLCGGLSLAVRRVAGLKLPSTVWPSDGEVKMYPCPPLLCRGSDRISYWLSDPTLPTQLRERGGPPGISSSPPGSWSLRNSDPTPPSSRALPLPSLEKLNCAHGGQVAQVGPPRPAPAGWGYLRRSTHPTPLREKRNRNRHP